MASGRASEFLAKRFAEVNRIHGFHMILEENRLRLGKTLWSQRASPARRGVPHNIAAYFEGMRELQARGRDQRLRVVDVPLRKPHGLPILSIDNMQVIHRCTLPAEILAGHEVAFQLTKAFIKAKLPGCDAYSSPRSFVHPRASPTPTCSLRSCGREILAAKATASAGEHLLVYQHGRERRGRGRARAQRPRVPDLRHAPG